MRLARNYNTERLWKGREHFSLSANLYFHAIINTSTSRDGHKGELNPAVDLHSIA